MMKRLICSLAIVVLFVSPAFAQQPKLSVKPLRLVEVRERDMAPKPKDDQPRMSFTFGPQQAGLTLTLQLKGEPAKSATHYGHLNFKIRDDKGQTLKLNTAGMFSDPAEEFVEVPKVEMSFNESESPADELRIEIPISLPARSATKIDVQGELQLQVAETVDVLVDDALNKRGAVETKQLKDAGVTITIGEPKKEGWMGDASFGFVCTVKGDQTRVLDMELVDANGKTLEGGGHQSGGFGDEFEHVRWFEEKPAAGTKLKLVVAAKQSTLKVPVDLKGIELP